MYKRIKKILMKIGIFVILFPIFITCDNISNNNNSSLGAVNNNNNKTATNSNSNNNNITVPPLINKDDKNETKIVWKMKNNLQDSSTLTGGFFIFLILGLLAIVFIVFRSYKYVLSSSFINLLVLVIIY